MRQTSAQTRSLALLNIFGFAGMLVTGHTMIFTRRKQHAR